MSRVALESSSFTPDQPSTRQRVFWWLLVVAYSVSIILLHRQGNLSAGRLSERWGMSLYLSVSRAAAVVGAVLVLLVLARTLWTSRARLKAFLVFLPVALTLDQTLISVPIERIHYPQYGFLAWIAFKATGNQLAAVLLAFVVGYVDEGFQYFVLYATDRFVYFDWNDILLNLTAALGVFLFFLPSVEPAERIPWKKMGVVIAGWAAVVGLMVVLGNPDRYLFGNQENAFWTTTTIDTTFHVLKASEGLFLVGVVWIAVMGYYLPGRLRRLAPTPAVDADA